MIPEMMIRKYDFVMIASGMLISEPAGCGILSCSGVGFTDSRENRFECRGLRFEIKAKCAETGARAGLLHTAHGIVETPVFMPVGTQATVKGIAPRELENDLRAQILLANTYHLFLRPGHEIIERLGGLHRFMSWPRAILTDSGGFQVFSLDGLREVTEEGVSFRSHLNGDLHFFTPELAVDIQLAFGSDVLMALDECLPYPVSYDTATQSTRRTIRWARAGYAHYLQREKGMDCALFPIVQGSMFPELRRECADALVELEAPGYAIGGLAVGEPRELSQEIAAFTARLLPPDRPRYVMGVGMPEELARVCIERHRHDGLCTSDAQRPEWIPVYVARESGYQTGAIYRG